MPSILIIIIPSFEHHLMTIFGLSWCPHIGLYNGKNKTEARQGNKKDSVGTGWLLDSKKAVDVNSGFEGHLQLIKGHWVKALTRTRKPSPKKFASHNVPSLVLILLEPI